MLRKLLGGRPAAGADDPVDTAFGALERDVLDVLWGEGQLAVRDVQSRLTRPIAYTTVMTTLDRLYKKGILVRRRSGRAFLYSAAVSRPQLKALVAGRLLAGLLKTGEAASPVLSNLVDSVGAQQGGAELLEELEALVRDKRRELRQNPPRPRSS